MLWNILAIAMIVALAWAMRKAAKGTPFVGRCPCTPYIEHLRWLEEKNAPGKEQKKENLW